MIECVLRERATNYGDYSKVAQVAHYIKSAIYLGPNYKNLSPAQAESLDMIASKIARIVNGDTSYEDNWIDIIGYATLALKTMDTRDGDQA